MSQFFASYSGVDVPLSFGSESEFLSSGNASSNDVTVLDSSGVVVAYWDADDDDRGKAKVGTVSGTSITFGDSVEFVHYYHITSLK